MTNASKKAKKDRKDKLRREKAKAARARKAEAQNAAAQDDESTSLPGKAGQKNDWTPIKGKGMGPVTSKVHRPQGK